MSTNQQISTAIKAILSSKDLTVIGLAKELNMTRESVGRRLSDRQSWTLDELDTTAHYLGFPDAYALNDMAREFLAARAKLSIKPEARNERR